MSEEPRRSGRATKGQHKGASSSPAPAPKAGKKGKKASGKKKDEVPDEEEEIIRCVCGDTNPDKKGAFIACDACSVWQHNICMGVTDDEDDQPDHYFCEECRPEEHTETLLSIQKAEKPPIWETRNKIYANERKMSKQRKGAKEKPPGWLKKEVPLEELKEPGDTMEVDEKPTDGDSGGPVQEAGGKRKRENVSDGAEKAEKQPNVESVETEKPQGRSQRADKRRKATSNDHSLEKVDPDTALVPIADLPADRQKVAQALSKTIADDINQRVREGFRIPDGHTAKSLGEHHAVRIEYALHMNHGEPKEPSYAQQFRTLNANLKKNKVLVERLLAGSLTADELSTMPSADMASEQLMRERAAMKAENDRQAVRVTEENGPRYRRTHKGDEIVEDEGKQVGSDNMVTAQPVHDRHYSVAEEGGVIGSPPNAATSPTETDRRMSVDTSKRPSEPARTSSGNFNVENIWAKTGAGSPVQSKASMSMQMPPRRRSSAQHQRTSSNVVQHDADIDRMLQDNDDEEYSPEDVYEDGTVWRGKLSQASASEGDPTINARFVAGRDLAPTIPWRDALPAKLTIDGRLQIAKAEEYLCGLQWSSSSDVSVLALTPYDDRAAFDAVFEYFKSRQRYAVVNRDKPALCKDFYIIPVEKGGSLPEHVSMLEWCNVRAPVEERLLLATLVVQRAPMSPTNVQSGTPSQHAPRVGPATNGNGAVPQHIRTSVNGPGGSPLNVQQPFSPLGNTQTSQTAAAGPSAQPAAGSPFPPNPYGAQNASPAKSLAADILGPFLNTPTAQMVLQSDPNVQRDKLEHLRTIMEEDPSTRTDIERLAERLSMNGH